MTGDSDSSRLEPMNSSPHLSAETVADYRGRRLGAAQILALHDHADRCGTCRDLLTDLSDIEDASHLSEQEAVDYVAGGVSPAGSPDRESHLAVCEACQCMVDDLRAFRRELQQEVVSGPARSRNFWPYAAAAALILMAGATLLLTRHAGSGPPAVIAELADGPVPGSLSGATRQLIAEALASGSLPAGPSMAVSRDSLRSAGTSGTPDASFIVVSPYGTRVYSDRPSFQWTALPGAEFYEVAVFDGDLNELARSDKVNGTEWQPPRALPRTRPLTWQVAALRRGERITAPKPPDPAAVFEIVSERAAREIAEAKAAAQPSHLALAVLYAREGMRREAAAETGRLAALNPGSAVPQLLLRSLQAPSAQ